jgi:organic radical activating enzyme
MSPKSGNPIKINAGDELKLVFPQSNCAPKDFEHLHFKHFFLQPMDGPNQAENIQLAAAYCLANPLWRLSLQTHKLIGLP